MALATRSAQADVDAITAVEAGNKIPRLPGDPLTAGEDLDAVAPCYIQSSDGKLYMSDATSDDESAEVVGFTAMSYKAGEPVTLFRENTVFHYADDFSGDDSIAPGDVLFVGETAGRLDDTATTGDSAGCAVVLSNQHILVTRANGK